MIADYLMLWDALQEVELQPGIDDKFIWRWSADGTYGAATAYRAFFHGTTGLAGAREVWRACCPHKVKFFFWLALRKRLWTAERRWRHGPGGRDVRSPSCRMRLHARDMVPHPKHGRSSAHRAIAVRHAGRLVARGQEGAFTGVF